MFLQFCPLPILPETFSSDVECQNQLPNVYDVLWVTKTIPGCFCMPSVVKTILQTFLHTASYQIHP
jgi:hypothetical protein